jgi:hypothetical protein
MLTCDMDMYMYAVLRLRYLTPACLRDGRAASRCTGGEVVLRGDGSGMLVLMFSVVQCVFASFRGCKVDVDVGCAGEGEVYTAR